MGYLLQADTMSLASHFIRLYQVPDGAMAGWGKASRLDHP